jgi:hypothetical protein
MGRKLRDILLLAAVAGLAFAAPASADPDGDYLNIMGNTPGVIGGPINNAIYTSQGHRACDLQHSGVSHDDAVAQLTVPMYVQPWLARAMVDAAQVVYCPETK